MTTIELSATARRHLLDTLQIGAGVLAVGALLLAPPAKGTIAFYPLTASAEIGAPPRIAAGRHEYARMDAHGCAIAL